MKKNKILLLLSVICLFINSVAVAQFKLKFENIADTQIKKSIQTFSNLINSQNAREFGLNNVAELKTLKAGKQFKKFMIGLDDIKNFKPGDNVNKIIKGYHSMEVALVNPAGTIRTSIEFTMKNNRWEASGYGSTPELIILKNAQAAVGDSLVNKGNLIRIPALRTSFLAVPSASGLYFIILEDKQNIKLKKGDRLNASDAILRLVPIANKHNGLPN